jgi:hypothetical protein
MSEEYLFLYLAIFFFLVSAIQHYSGVALYFSLFSKFTGARIVAKKDDREDFNLAISLQVLSGIFFLILEIFL